MVKWSQVWKLHCTLCNNTSKSSCNLLTGVQMPYQKFGVLLISYLQIKINEGEVC